VILDSSDPARPVQYFVRNNTVLLPGVHRPPAGAPLYPSFILIYGGVAVRMKRVVMAHDTAALVRSAGLEGLPESPDLFDLRAVLSGGHSGSLARAGSVSGSDSDT
jgi:hypothetical protein